MVGAPVSRGKWVLENLLGSPAPLPPPNVPPLPESEGAQQPASIRQKMEQHRQNPVCAACHKIGPGAKNGVGPSLNGVANRKSGQAEGYAYSDANKNSGITWDEATFKEYITAPQKKIPGTKMTFPGLPEEADRNNVWAYLSQFKADGSK